MPYLSLNERIKCFVIVKLICVCSTFGNSPWHWTCAHDFISVSDFLPRCLTCHSTSVWSVLSLSDWFALALLSGTLRDVGLPLETLYWWAIFHPDVLFVTQRASEAFCHCQIDLCLLYFWKLSMTLDLRSRLHIGERFFTLMPYLSLNERLKCFVIVKLICVCSTSKNSPWHWTSAQDFISVSDFLPRCLTCHSTSVWSVLSLSDWFALALLSGTLHGVGPPLETSYQWAVFHSNALLVIQRAYKVFCHRQIDLRLLYFRELPMALDLH
jgi:hypothetical protein